MSTGGTTSLDELSVLIEPINVESHTDSVWRISWTITNCSTHELELRDMRIPHDQFRAGDTVFEPPVVIAPGSAGMVLSRVTFGEPAGSTLTYPFIILRASWQGVQCRIFARLRVAADASGVPRPIVEEVTVGLVPSEQ